MGNTRRDFQPFPLLQTDAVIFENHHPPAFENKKELARGLMIVHLFRTSGRYTLLDHADIRTLQQVPAVTCPAPQVMFGVKNGDGRDHGTADSDLAFSINLQNEHRSEVEVGCPQLGHGCRCTD